MTSRFSRRQMVKAAVLGLASATLPACGGGSDSKDLPVDDDHGTPGPGPEPCVVPEPQTGPQQPRGLHVSWTDDLFTTRTMTWFTDGSRDPGSIVEYGPLESGMEECHILSAPFPFRASGLSHETYGVDALTHAATISSIDPERGIRYRVGSSGGGWSEVHTLPPFPREKFRFCHFGDQAVRDSSRRVMDSVRQQNPDFLLVAGDLSYANGDQPIWDRYFDMLEPYTARLPMMTCPGNHEAKDGRGQGYRTRFSQPGEGTYFTWDVHRVHFLFSTGGSLLRDLSTTKELMEELDFMEKDLADAYQRRQNGEIDFIVLVQHYPLWTNTEGRSPANFSLVALEEKMLLRYEVDLVLAGHDHLYERSHPMMRGKQAEGGYIQVTQGGGGKSLYSLIDKPAAWAAVSRVCHGYTVLEVEGRTLRAQSYAVSDSTGALFEAGADQLIDSFEIHARVPVAVAISASGARHAATASGLALPLRKARRLEEMEIDLHAMLLHTIQRNRDHDLHEEGLEHDD
ncbi:purple acid phosphatase family protein [Kerstersia similis]|uniref:purple acid phosphatase family protein n=1 Tax=Kerstersia similis TaxID=206505 RepID=UPI0039F00832